MPPISNHRATPSPRKEKEIYPNQFTFARYTLITLTEETLPPLPATESIITIDQSPFLLSLFPIIEKNQRAYPPLRSGIDYARIYERHGDTLARGVSNHPIKFRWKFVRAKNCGGQRDSSSRQDSRTWNPGTYVPASHYHTCHQAPLALYSAGAPSFPYLATSGVPSPAPLLTHASAFEIRGDNVTWSSEEIMEKYFRLFRRIQAIAGWSGVRSRWWLGYQENWLWGNGYLFFQMKMKYSTFQWSR